MPSDADIARQRVSVKKLLRDSADVYRRPTAANGIPQGALTLQHSAYPCRVVVPLRYPGTMPYETTMAHQDGMWTKDERAIEFAWDADIQRDDQLRITRAGVTTKYTVLDVISDLTDSLLIQTLCQRIP